MKDIRASESRVFGFLSILVFALFFTMAAFIEFDSLWTKLIICIVAVVAPVSAILGIGAQSVYLDEDEIVFECRNKSLKRFLLTDVKLARTIPYWDELDAIWMRTSSGECALTIVRQHDTTYSMSQFPREAVTPYWRNRIGEQE